MGIRLPHRSDYDQNSGERWDECVLCGTRLYTALVHFYSGSAEPTADSYSSGDWSGGETVTGATSSDTGVVHKVVRVSGAWADGDAAGVLILRSPTGYEPISSLEIFEKDELLNGSVSGDNFATATSVGAIQISGRLIPESDLVEYRGKKYCRAHFRFTYENDWKNEADVSDDENDREA